MAADQERAERIRALKQERPDLTWRRIADHVGVTERSATDWQRKGGIEYDNAKKLAALFEVNVDYIWRGTESDTPSPFAGQDEVADRLDRLEQQLTRIELMLLGKADSMLISGDVLVERLDKLDTALHGRVDALKTETDELLPLMQAIVEGRPQADQATSPRTPRSKRHAKT